jgi:hypothetical protein
MGKERALTIPGSLAAKQKARPIESQRNTHLGSVPLPSPLPSPLPVLSSLSVKGEELKELNEYSICINHAVCPADAMLVSTSENLHRLSLLS